MDEVILARHGESELSVVGTVNGDPAVACALTAAGREQARRLGELLADTELDLCVTSEFERAERPPRSRSRGATSSGWSCLS
jgi:broad specificity phosphatase PhoE